MDKREIYRYLACLFVLVLVCFSLWENREQAEATRLKNIESVIVKIDEKNVTEKNFLLRKGKKAKIEVLVSPDIPKKNVHYQSENKGVATVTKDGEITTKKEGIAKIRITVSKQKYKRKTTWVKIKVKNRKQTMLEQVENQKSSKEKTEYYDVTYDTISKAQKLDLFLPESGTGPFPLVVFIHGGGWFSGNKQDGQETAWIDLRKDGYAIASIDYRLSNEAPHPAGIIDCKTAIRFLKAHAKKYQIDSNRIAVAGDSSGGHYALMVALTMGNLDFEDLSRGYEKQDSNVKCAVVWYPATDLAETMKTVENGQYTGYGADFAWSNIERYVGKKIKKTDDQLLVDASPITYISINMPPVLLQHGDADTICPIDQSRRFYNKAVKIAGKEKVTLDILKDAEHGDSAFETRKNIKRICDFLDNYLK